MTRRSIVLLAFLLPACSPSAPGGSNGSGERPPAGSEVLEEDWYRLRIAGRDAGSSYRRAVRLADGDILTTFEQEMTIARGDTPLQAGARIEIREDAAGTVERYTLTTRMARQEVVKTGEVDGGTVRLTTTEAGVAREAPPKTFDPAARGPYWIELRMREAIRKPGDVFETIQFAPEKDASGRLEATAVAEEETDVGGERRRLLRVEVRQEVLPGVTSDMWLDGEGITWKLRRKALGMDFEEVRVTSRDALEAVRDPPEVFVATSIRPDRPLRDGADSIVYRFTLLEGDFASLGLEDLFTGVGQTIVREESPSARVVRIARVPPPPAPPGDAARPAEVEPFLRPNAFVQSDDPAIIDLARSEVGGETDPLAAARRLERWVHRSVRSKDLSTAFASARETLESRQGDCTEHAVLLAALARAAGIPARVVSGLIYHQGSFVGHMWTEVFAGAWYPLDATRGRGSVGPEHIGLSASDLHDATASEAFFDLIAVIGNLRIEVLEQ